MKRQVLAAWRKQSAIEMASEGAKKMICRMVIAVRYEIAMSIVYE